MFWPEQYKARKENGRGHTADRAHFLRRTRERRAQPEAGKGKVLENAGVFKDFAAGPGYFFFAFREDRYLAISRYTR